MYPHLTSVIFKSEGAEGFGVCSTAACRPFPNVTSGANGAKTATAADFDRNDLRELEFAIFGVLDVTRFDPSRIFESLPWELEAYQYDR